MSATMTAEGTNRRFHHTETTTGTKDAVWELWTDPATWSGWDEGLERAELEGPFVEGACGVITPLKGRRAAFTVEAVDMGQSYTFATKLPGAVLRVRREFVASEPTTSEHATAFKHTAFKHIAFKHTVWFDGPMAWLFSRLLGGQFRRALPPTMASLARMAEAR